jgi:hypothetical protein
MFMTRLLAIILMCATIVGAAEFKPASQTDWEKIIAAAKKEGEVRLWGNQEITHPDIVTVFSRQYPI